MIGRETELQELVAALAGLEEGAGRAVALVGDPGIGKSALMGAVAAEARAAGIPVCAARGRAVTAPAHAAAPSPQDLRDVAARAAGGGPLLAVVEDFHLLAADQLPHMEQLLQATTGGQVLCLIGCRQRQLSAAAAEMLSRTASGGLLEVWELGPLTREQAAELLGDHPGMPEIYQETMGNPQYLKVLGAHDRTGAEAVTAVLGELAGLDTETLALLQAAAVLGESFHPELLAAVAGQDAAVTMRVLDTLTRLDLVRPAEPAPHLAVRHRAVSEVVYQRLEPSRRTDLHRRADAALAEQAAPVSRRVRHVAGAADPSRPEHVTILIAAARSVLYSSPAAAAGYLKAALPLLREGQEHWHEAQVLLARARLLTGDASEGRQLLDALRSAMPGRPDEVTALVDSSRLERRLGRYSEAGALARSGLAVLADQDAAIAAALHTELSDHAYDLQEYETSREHADTAAAIAQRHRDHVGEARALAQAALGYLFTGDVATAQARAATAAGLIDSSSDTFLLTHLDASVQVGLTEGMLGRLLDADRHLTRAATLSRRTGQTYIEPQILAVLANARLRSGNLDGALAVLDESTLRGERVVGPAEEAVAAMVRAEILFWRDGPGDRQGAEASAAHALAVSGGTPTPWAVAVRCFHAEFVLRTGDPERARWLLLESGGGTDLSRLTAWRKPRWCDTLAQASLAMGARASVEQYAQLAERCVAQLPSPGRKGFALRARMRAHAARGETAAAVEKAVEAFSDFSLSGERIEACVTLLAAAALSLDAGRTQDVADWLAGAAVLADQCRSARLIGDVSRLRSRLADHTGTTGVLPSLTAREREIATLASTGMTNAGIAAALVLSVRTVETHLRQVYRKLGVSNRAALTRRMLDDAASRAREPDAV
ncbi:LuxR C-terminal-related transcriptional regulator [Streptomyces sp. NPDC001348]